LTGSRVSGAPLANPLGAPFVHAVGGELHVRVEEHPNPDYVDHVWITMDAGSAGRPLVSINTLSKRNRDAGFDPRIRVGRIRGSWDLLPQRGLEAATHLDYAELEQAHSVYYEHYERPAMEKLLLTTARRATLLEVWGAPYRNKKRLGIHQIHSRRASCAVTSDIRGHDGALRFYFPEDKTTAMFLFKFCGQP
jgi:hypothetical protein